LAVPTNFVKKQVVNLLGIASEKVIRIPAAVSPPSWVTDIHRGEINKENKPISNKYGIEEYIMFLARQTNVPTALSLIKLLKTDYDLETTLIIAGIGIDKTATENLAKNLNLKLEKDVLILGATSEQLKWTLLKEAKLFLSLETSTSGFGIPGLEAMSVGTPVVASDTGPTREVLGEGALLAKPNLQDMARAIHDCFTDRKLSEQLSHRGLERAKDFHPAKIAAHLLKIMNEIASL
jgi:glycosyltransferase involved in cell wall biosynthesis